MSYYSVDRSGHVSSSRWLLLGPPLLIAVTFSFGYLVMQPRQDSRQPMSAAPNSPLIAKPKSNLPDLKFVADTPLPLIKSGVTSSGGQAPPLNTADPQPGNSSGYNPQTAAPAGQQPANLTQPTIITPSTSDIAPKSKDSESAKKRKNNRQSDD